MTSNDNMQAKQIQAAPNKCYLNCLNVVLAGVAHQRWLTKGQDTTDKASPLLQPFWCPVVAGECLEILTMSQIN